MNSIMNEYLGGVVEFVGYSSRDKKASYHLALLAVDYSIQYN